MNMDRFNHKQYCVSFCLQLPCDKVLIVINFLDKQIILELSDLWIHALTVGSKKLKLITQHITLDDK